MSSARCLIICVFIYHYSVPFYASVHPADDVGGSMFKCIRMSVRLCMRPCVPRTRNSPTGLPLTSVVFIGHASCQMFLYLCVCTSFKFIILCWLYHGAHNIIRLNVIWLLVLIKTTTYSRRCATVDTHAWRPACMQWSARVLRLVESLEWLVGSFL